MAAWGGNHFSPLLLLYRELDGYTQVQVTLFFAAYILGLIPGFLIAGPLSDRYGRRRLVAVALALGVAGSVILALGSASVLGMCLGRLVSGVSVAAAMVAGTSWIKELSQHDADPATRARRASLTLTAGFGIGAGVSGVLAQWGPAPSLLPYAVQILLSALAVLPLRRAPETVVPDRSRPLLGDLSAPPHFWGLILPMAPWVFAAPALAFVVAPALVAEHTGGYRIAFATLAAVITLIAGASVQPFVPRLATLLRGRHGVAGLLLCATATGLLAMDAVSGSPTLAAGTAVLCGAAYGICIVAGLVEVQAMAGPANLAGLTGVYWSLTYVGFALPVALAGLNHLVPYDALLLGVATVCLLCAGLVYRASAKGN